MEDKSAKAPKAVSPYAYVVLAVLTCVYALSWFHRMVLTMFLEPMRRDLSLSDTQLGLLTGAAFIALYAVAAVPIARTADRYSRSILITACLAFWSVATALTSAAGSFLHLAIARMGVGIGEAGFGPIANSLLASLFPKERLGRAVAIFAAGATVGLGLAYPIGGWLLGAFGWRQAIVIAAAPGLALAVVTALVIREPRRPAADARPKPPPLGETFKIIFDRRSALYLGLGAASLTIADAAALNWFPTFLMRVHGTPPEALNLVFGMLFAVTQATSVIVGGMIVDALMRRDVAWVARVPAICAVCAWPLAATVYLAPDATVALYLVIVPLIFSAAYFAPIIAVAQLIVPESMRALTVALIYVTINAIGYGLGPLLVGVISDALGTRFGARSLQIALLIATCGYGLGFFAFMTAAGRVKADIAKNEAIT